MKIYKEKYSFFEMKNQRDRTLARQINKYIKHKFKISGVKCGYHIDPEGVKSIMGYYGELHTTKNLQF